MKRRLFVLLVPLICCAANAPPALSPGWTPAEIADLRHWVTAAPEDALPVLATTDLDRGLAGNEPATVDGAATALALQLARMHLLGTACPAERHGWGIVDSDNRIDVAARLAQALAAAPTGSADGLDRFFDDLKPHHPDYAALRAAYATEQDPARRATFALNMERWRWMPLSPGPDYLLVNATIANRNLPIAPLHRRK